MLCLRDRLLLNRSWSNQIAGWVVEDAEPQSRAAYLRGVAETLRGIAAQLRYDFRRRDQLLALAAGFERFADRVEQEAKSYVK